VLTPTAVTTFIFLVVLLELWLTITYNVLGTPTCKGIS
jgi:hypothetical protein